MTTMEDNDNAVPVKSRILIQSDWNEGRASWLMVKTPGETSLRGAFDDAAATSTPEKDAADGFSATKLRNTLVSFSVRCLRVCPPTCTFASVRRQSLSVSPPAGPRVPPPRRIRCPVPGAVVRLAADP